MFSWAASWGNKDDCTSSVVFTTIQSTLGVSVQERAGWSKIWFYVWGTDWFWGREQECPNAVRRRGVIQLGFLFPGRKWLSPPPHLGTPGWTTPLEVWVSRSRLIKLIIHCTLQCLDLPPSPWKLVESRNQRESMTVAAAAAALTLMTSPLKAGSFTELVLIVFFPVQSGRYKKIQVTTAFLIIFIVGPNKWQVVEQMILNSAQPKNKKKAIHRKEIETLTT